MKSGTVSGIISLLYYYRKLGIDGLQEFYEKLVTARVIEEELFKKISWHGRDKRVYYGIGQEAGPIAICDLLEKEDYLIPPYRGIAHVLGKGLETKKVIAEILSSSSGPLRGLGNPGSFTDPELGIFPNCDVLGNNFAVAVGMGFEAKRSSERVMCIFFGDGASTRSTFYGSLNLSALWALPILWVCENNKYSLATRYDRSSRTSVAEKASSFGIKVKTVDGNDILKVKKTAENLLSYIRKERKPALIELDTYRMVQPSEADTFWYRDKGEWESWKQKDPVEFFRLLLLLSRLFSATELRDMELNIRERIRIEVAEALRVYDKGAEMVKDEYATRFEKSKTTGFHAVSVSQGKGKKMKMVEVLRETLQKEMRQNSSVFILGEDVGMYGGRRGVTKGLFEEFGPERVVDTPINEELFVGIAIGAAQAGLRPIVEYSHAAFLMLAASDIHRMGFWQIINLQKFSLSIVIRAVFGSGYDAYGEELALSPISAFLNWKGICMVMPSNARQAKGLLKSALASDAPVVFFEHRMLYKEEDVIPEDDFFLPLDKAEVLRAGVDWTVLSYGYLTKLALEAAEILSEKYSIETEVVDLISLKPLDGETILVSANKTKNILILDEEKAEQAGLFASLATVIRSEIPDARILGLGCGFVPLPFGKRAKEFLPSKEKIVKKILFAHDSQSVW